MIKFKLFGFGSGPAVPTESPEAESQTAPVVMEEAPVNPEGKRVVIVDDDAVYLKATAMKLAAAGFRVVTAKEGSEAIAALGEQPADAVLMDVDFAPDVGSGGIGSWNGFHLIKWLRGLPGARGTRFIMVSNSDSASHRQRAQEVGAVAYFKKPVDHEKLFEMVNATN